MTASSEWIGGVHPLKTPIVAAGEPPYFPVVAVWVDGQGIVLGSEVGIPGDDAQILRAALSKALKSGSEPPSALRVEREEWFDAVRFVAPRTAALRVAPTPELAELRGDLDRSLSPRSLRRQKFGPEGFTEGGTIPATAIGKLFEAAGRFFGHKPWELVPHDAPFAVDIPELGIEQGCLTILGHAGDVRGLAFYETTEDFFDFMEAAEAGGPLEGRQLHLGFERKSDLSAAAIREMEKHGWKPAGRGATPFVFPMIDGDFVPATARDVILCTVLAEAASRFCAKLDQPVQEDSEDMAFEMGREDDLPALTLLWPHPEVSDPDGLFLDAFFQIEEEEKIHDLEVVEAFLDSVSAFKDDLSQWSASEVEAFLLREVPEDVPLQDAELKIFPKLLQRLISFSARFYEGVGQEDVAIRLAQIRSLEQAFLFAIRDMSRWSPGKIIIMRGIREGVDFRDAAAVDALVESYNRGLSPVVRTAPRVSRNDPCPCGSGKKFKKCCLALPAT